MSDTIKVLVAERDDDTAREITRAFSVRGWTVLQARDAVAATSTVLRHRPDAVVLDVQLPGGGGLVALRRIRASVHTTMTPVIAIAGSRDDDGEQLRLNGADEWVLPPADAAAIDAWVHARLEGEPEPVVLEAPDFAIRNTARLASLRRTGLLDSEPSDAYDTLTLMASRLLGVPVALVSLVDANRQFFKSQVGLPEPWAAEGETPLTHSFCQWVVSEHEPLIVADAREHPVLKANQALDDLGVVAYAGVPITATSGDPLGSFCAIDGHPREWSIRDIELLQDLSRVAEACIAIGQDPESDSSATGSSADHVATLSAMGVGISTASDIIRREGPTLGDDERRALLDLIRWFGEYAAAHAGTAPAES
jgi:DNA-binding response OmpR family regulator